MFAVWELLFSEAVMVAVVSLLTVPAVAVKVAVEEPDATFTLPGTLSVPELLESATAVLPDAALVRVTVQVDVPDVPRLDGLHETALTWTTATSEMFAVRVLPFSEAVMVAVASLLTVPAVAVKVALEEPEFTVTLPGTLNVPELLERPTESPPLPAAFDKVTVQLEVAAVPRLAGVHDRLLTAAVVTREMLAVCVLPL